VARDAGTETDRKQKTGNMRHRIYSVINAIIYIFTWKI
jgi:hypothetical protein